MSIDCNIRSCSNEFAQVVIREGDDDLPLCLSCTEAFRLGMNSAQVQFVLLEDWESDETENGAIIFCRISNCQAEAIQVAIREGENDLPLCGSCIEAFSQGMNCPEGQIVSLEEWLSEEDEEDGELPWWGDPAADTLINKAVMELDFLEEESDVRQQAWWDDPAAETLANMAVKEAFYPGSTIQDGTSSSASPG